MPGAGTDKTKNWVREPAPVVVLVETQLGDNIGSAARAMANFGLSRLRLVKPREPWPNARAKVMASGADRILDGRSPYGSFPIKTQTPCGTRYADGTYSGYIQADGRCETAIERGDTYGPAMYLAYVPGTAALGWTGRWDDLPAAHFTTGLFDLLTSIKVTLQEPAWSGFGVEAYLFASMVYLAFCAAMSAYSRRLERAR